MPLETRDPEPLVIIETGDWTSMVKKAKSLANSWAREHPEAMGYLIVSAEACESAVGNRYFLVRNGESEACGASDCRPIYFAEQQARLAGGR